MMELRFEKNAVYSENEIYGLVKRQKQDVSEQKLKWILYELERDGVLSRIGTKRYITGVKKYTYELRKESKAIDEFISSSFPEANYVIWESTQLNEWVNFLLNQNTIFIDVEKELFDFVIDGLMEELGNEYTILINPDEQTVSRYGRDNLVIVKKLFSRSPSDKKEHKIKLEKLIVDLLCDKYYSWMLDSSAIEEVFAGVKKSYAIDATKMLNYAKRRGVLSTTKTLWGDESDQ